MIPVVLDPERVSMAVVGRGESARRRLRGLVEGGGSRITVYSDEADPALVALAGPNLCRRLPGSNDLLGFQVVWITGLPTSLAHAVARDAEHSGALVNVEDDRDSCDFHNVAQVRRGDLLLTVSTGGKSPGLAARVRRSLEGQYGPEWANRLKDLGTRRVEWQAQGRPASAMAELTDGIIDRGGWL